MTIMSAGKSTEEFESADEMVIDLTSDDKDASASISGKLAATYYCVCVYTAAACQVYRKESCFQTQYHSKKTSPLLFKPCIVFPSFHLLTWFCKTTLLAGGVYHGLCKLVVPLIESKPDYVKWQPTCSPLTVYWTGQISSSIHSMQGIICCSVLLTLIHPYLLMATALGTNSAVMMKYDTYLIVGVD